MRNKIRTRSLICITALVITVLAIAGCSDMPYTGSMLTADDVDRYLTSKDGETYCLVNGPDSACLTLTPKVETQHVNAPIIHIYPQKIVYVFYREGVPVLEAEKVIDTTEIVERLTEPEPEPPPLEDPQPPVEPPSDPDTSPPMEAPQPEPEPESEPEPPVYTPPQPPVAPEPEPPSEDIPPPVIQPPPQPPVNVQPPPSEDPQPPEDSPPSEDPPSEDPPPEPQPPPVITPQPPVDPPPVTQPQPVDPPPPPNTGDAWLIKVYYDVPPMTLEDATKHIRSRSTLAESGFTITINDVPITDDDITSRAGIVERDKDDDGLHRPGFQFIYRTTATELVITVKSDYSGPVEQLKISGF